MSLPRPHWIREHVAAVDFAALAAAGRRILLVDLDNTLAPHGAWEPDALALEALRAARSAGRLDSICIVSNFGYGRRRLQRVAHFAAIFECAFVGAAWWESKPSPRPLRRALALLGASPSAAVFIGDQLFTDIAAARRIGLVSVLVRPLGPDGWATRLTLRRLREAPLRQRWEAEGDLPFQ